MPPGLWGVAVVTAVLILVLWVVFYGSAARIFVRQHLPPPTGPIGPPIETLAADLKRLRLAILAVEPGTSQVRRSATVAAYDDALVQACLALDLPDTLTLLTPGAGPRSRTTAGRGTARGGRAAVHAKSVTGRFGIARRATALADTVRRW